MLMHDMFSGENSLKIYLTKQSLGTRDYTHFSIKVTSQGSIENLIFVIMGHFTNFRIEILKFFRINGRAIYLVSI